MGKAREREITEEETQMVSKLLKTMFSLLVIMEVQVQATMGLPWQPPADGKKNFNWIMTSIGGDMEYKDTLISYWPE